MADVRGTARTGLETLTLPAESAIAVVTATGVATRVSLRVRESDVEVVGRALSADLSGRINTAVMSGSLAALRLGPDEWLLLADGEMLGSHDVLAGRIAATPYAAVDVSDRFVAIEIAGPAVEDVLAAGCPLPLDQVSFRVGRATRTLFAKAEIVLWRLAGNRFRIEVGRSFAPYLVGLLATVIRDEASIGRQAAAR
jgi:sarcosine oxidase subunit gamma